MKAIDIYIATIPSCYLIRVFDKAKPGVFFELTGIHRAMLNVEFMATYVALNATTVLYGPEQMLSVHTDSTRLFDYVTAASPLHRLNTPASSLLRSKLDDQIKLIEGCHPIHWLLDHPQSRFYLDIRPSMLSLQLLRDKGIR